jgi:hypothetical protein
LELLSAQRKCLRYDPPAGAVAFTMDAGETVQSGLAKQMRAPPSSLGPADWSAFELRLGKPRQSHGMIFLHERTSPAGHRRLVVIDLHVDWFKDGAIVSLDKAVAKPATWRSDPAWVAPTQRPEDAALTRDLTARHTVLSVPFDRPFQLFPARADPADASRFTIDFRRADQSGVIDGQLRDDDTVALDVRGAAPRKHPSLPVRLPDAAPPPPAR